LNAAFESLPAAEHSVIERRSRGSVSFSEIAYRLHRCPEAARKRWFRAIARLRPLL